MQPVSVDTEEGTIFIVAHPKLTFLERLRVMVHGVMLVAAESEIADHGEASVTVAIPTIYGVLRGNVKRGFRFASYKARHAQVAG